MSSSDIARRGGDAWAFSVDGSQPLTPYLGWLWWEAKELRRWVRSNWSSMDEYHRKRQHQMNDNPDARVG